MSGDSAIHPPIAWAQRKELLYLTIQVEDLQEKQLNFTDDKLIFKGTGGQPTRAYACELEFFKTVKPDTMREKPSGKQLIITVKKSEAGPFWPRLLKDGRKVNWLKTDFEKWRDENDSDVDEPIGVDDSIEAQMANLGKYDESADREDPPADDEDSDDDALPDLE